MPRFNVTVLSKSGNVKYMYDRKSFPTMRDAIDYYEQSGGRVIEVKEMGVRLKVAQEPTEELRRRSDG